MRSYCQLMPFYFRYSVAPSPVDPLAYGEVPTLGLFTSVQRTTRPRSPEGSKYLQASIAQRLVSVAWSAPMEQISMFSRGVSPFHEDVGKHGPDVAWRSRQHDSTLCVGSMD